jgi:hypothetical protein
MHEPASAWFAESLGAWASDCDPASPPMADTPLAAPLDEAEPESVNESPESPSESPLAAPDDP